MAPGLSTRNDFGVSLMLVGIESLVIKEPDFSIRTEGFPVNLHLFRWIDERTMSIR